jgi:hypothetical protein
MYTYFVDINKLLDKMDEELVFVNINKEKELKWFGELNVRKDLALHETEKLEQYKQKIAGEVSEQEKKLNALNKEVKKAITDFNTLKGKHLKEIKSLEEQVNNIKILIQKKHQDLNDLIEVFDARQKENDRLFNEKYAVLEKKAMDKLSEYRAYLQLLEETKEKEALAIQNRTNGTIIKILQQKLDDKGINFNVLEEFSK